MRIVGFRFPFKIENTEIKKLIELPLPSCLVDNFKPVKIDNDRAKSRIYIEENVALPEGYPKEDLVYHRLRKESQITDFPICVQQIVLVVKRRH